MLTRTESIILKSQKYGEADLIVTCLTSDKGIIRAFAKSPRKTKSRFGSSLEPLTHSKMSLWGKEQSAIPKITQSDIINSFHQLRESYSDFVNTSKLVEMLISLVPEKTPNRKLFSFFLNLLNYIKSSEEETKDALHIIARIRMLAAAGYAPRLNSCGRCEAESSDFYPDSGTILCRRCATGPGSHAMSFIRISNKTIHFYSHSIKWPIHISNRLKPDKQTLSEISLLLDRHIDHLLSKRLRSSEFPVSAVHQILN